MDKGKIRIASLLQLRNRKLILTYWSDYQNILFKDPGGEGVQVKDTCYKSSEIKIG